MIGFMCVYCFSCVFYLERFVDIWIWKGGEANVDTFWERYFLRYIDKHMHVSFVYTEDDSG